MVLSLESNVVAMASTLDDWYQNIYSRRVDLVGDYAGAELFLLEGDSLLLHAFSDPKLDFGDTGFQLLHAAYNVESFLRKMVLRKCNFHLAFFHDHEQLCIPSTASPNHQQKFLLARAAIIRHLKRNIATDLIPIHTFPTVTCTEFHDYLSDTGVYFVMCHDGAQTTDSSKTAFRQMIQWLVYRGYNIALINSIEFHDTKVSIVPFASSQVASDTS